MSNFQIHYFSFEHFQKKLEFLKERKINKIFMEMAQLLAEKMLQETTKNTPVDTGRLKRGWTGEKNQGIKKYISQLPLQKEKDFYEIELLNPVYYGIFVEYGHHTRSGSWVKGQYFLRISKQHIQSQKKQILAKKIVKQLQEVFKSAYGNH